MSDGTKAVIVVCVILGAFSLYFIIPSGEDKSEWLPNKSRDLTEDMIEAYEDEASDKALYAILEDGWEKLREGSYRGHLGLCDEIEKTMMWEVATTHTTLKEHAEALRAATNIYKMSASERLDELLKGFLIVEQEQLRTDLEQTVRNKHPELFNRLNELKERAKAHEKKLCGSILRICN